MSFLGYCILLLFYHLLFVSNNHDSDISLLEDKVQKLERNNQALKSELLRHGIKVHLEE